MSSDSADPFYWMRVILASNRGKSIHQRAFYRSNSTKAGQITSWLSKTFLYRYKMSWLILGFMLICMRFWKERELQVLYFTLIFKYSVGLHLIAKRFYWSQCSAWQNSLTIYFMFVFLLICENKEGILQCDNVQVQNCNQSVVFFKLNPSD